MNWAVITNILYTRMQVLTHQLLWMYTYALISLVWKLGIIYLNFNLRFLLGPMELIANMGVT
jgi:hypothetical protein